MKKVQNIWNQVNQNDILSHVQLKEITEKTKKKKEQTKGKPQRK